MVRRSVRLRISVGQALALHPPDAKAAFPLRSARDHRRGENGALHPQRADAVAETMAQLVTRCGDQQLRLPLSCANPVEVPTRLSVVMSSVVAACCCLEA